MPRPSGEFRVEACPACNKIGAAVIDSRPHRFGRLRRRRCFHCDHRWTTIEVPIELLQELEQCNGLDGINGVLASLKAVQAVRLKFIGAPEPAEELTPSSTPSKRDNANYQY